MIRKKIQLLITLFIILTPLKNVYAESLLGNISCIKDGKCGLNEILQVGVNATQILLGISGSIALLFFIYGGVTFLISGGSAEKVSQGKQIITNATIGLIIIFSSFMIIQFSMNAIGFSREGVWYQSL